MKTLDKQLRTILDGCEIQGEWEVHDVADRVVEPGYGSVCDLYGGRERYARAALVALAPELAREVLALRKEVRRLRKQVP